MFLKLYLIALPVFFAIDMLWLGLVARTFYRAQIGFLLRPEFNWIAAVSFYLLFLVGLIYFVVEPAAAARSWSQALFVGAFFGLVTYATYDLTNLATVRDWPLLITFVDMTWGAVLSASVAAVTTFIAIKLGL